MLANNAWTRATQRGLCAVLAVALVGGCTDTSAADPQVAAYVDRALDLMGTNGLFVDEHWGATVDRTRDATRDATSIAETYGPLSLALSAAGGRHSSLIVPSSQPEQVAPVDFPAARMVSERVAMLTIPPINSIDEADVDGYVSASLESIDSLRDSATCGWIVNLENNTGGNVYPMLLAVQPFLDESETIASFQDRNGQNDRLHFDGSTVMLGDVRMAEASISIETLESQVVVMQNASTASAAELVVIALADHPGGAIVGGESAGFTTANETFRLSDGTLLVLTTAYYVGPSGRIFDGPIESTIVRLPNQSSADAAASALESSCG